MGLDFSSYGNSSSSNPLVPSGGLADQAPGLSFPGITASPVQEPAEQPFNILGKPMTRAQLEGSDMGQQFLKTMDANRTGQRGFLEAITDVGVEDLPALQDSGRSRVAPA